MPALRVFRKVEWSTAVEAQLEEIGVDMEDARLAALDFYLATDRTLSTSARVPGATDRGRPVYAQKTEPFMGRILLCYFTIEQPAEGMEIAEVVRVLAPA